MFFGRPWETWTAQYAKSHEHPVNRACHVIGIPLIVVALALAFLALMFPELWTLALVLFVGGWIFQFVGHGFEGKPPEFFCDWRFLFVGLRWWIAKMRQ